MRFMGLVAFGQQQEREMKPPEIKEFEDYTGLQCKKDRYEENTWWALSPTGVRLFKIEQFASDPLGMISAPDLHKLQNFTVRRN